MTAVAIAPLISPAVEVASYCTGSSLTPLNPSNFDTPAPLLELVLIGLLPSLPMYFN